MSSERSPKGATPATVALASAGVSFTLHPYDHRPGTTRYGEEAVAALGVDAGEIFKTLVVDLGGELAVTVIPVAAQLDLKAAAAVLGVKRAVLADPAVAARSTGYVVGGISPVGQRTRLRTVVDASAAALPRMYVSAGRRGLQLRLSPSDLVRATNAAYASIAH